MNQFPKASVTQFNVAGTPLKEDQPIAPVPNPNTFTALPEINNMIRIILK